MQSLAVFRKGTILALLVQVGGEASGLLLAYVLAHGIGSAGLGRVEMVKAGMLLVSAFACIGLPNAVIRFLPSYCEQRAWPLARGVVRGFWWGTLVAGIIGGALVAVWAYFAHSGGTSARYDFLLTALGVPLVAVLVFQESLARIERSIVLALAPRYMLWSLLTVVGVVLTPKELLTPEYCLVMSLGVIAGITMLQGVLVARRMRKLIPVDDSTEATVPKVQTDWPNWLRAAVPLVLVSGSHRILRHADVLLLGVLASEQDAGIYAIAVAINAWVMFPLQAGNSIAAPLYSTLLARSDRTELNHLMSSYAVWVFTPSVVVAVLFAIIAPWFLPMFGPGFELAYIPFLILTVGELINVGTGSVGWLLQVSGNERACARVFLGAAAVNLVLNLVLIPRFGMLGSAIATGIANVIRNLVMLQVVRQLLGADPSVWGSFSRWNATRRRG